MGDQAFADGLLPEVLDRDTLPFWTAAREYRLTYQVCLDCERVVFYPRQHCPRCLGRSLAWRESAGWGIVYTYSVVRVSRDPRFVDRVPYCVAWVDLDEGFRMMSNVVDADPDTIEVGMRVRVAWRRSGQWVLPVFAPADPQAPASGETAGTTSAATADGGSGVGGDG